MPSSKQGNRIANKHISVFLDAPDSATYSVETGPSAAFTVHIHNQHNPDNTLSKGTEHTFTSSEPDWGFSLFAPLDEIANPTNGFRVNNRLILSIDLAVESKAPFQLDTGGVPHDVTLKLPYGAEFPAVSKLLQVASPFFRDALEDVTVSGPLPVDGSIGVWTYILSCLYPLHDQPHLTLRAVYALLPVVHKYNFAKLITRLVGFVKEKIQTLSHNPDDSETCVIRWIELAERLQLDGLRELCLSRLGEMMKEQRETAITVFDEQKKHTIRKEAKRLKKAELSIADAGHSSDALAVVLAVVQAQTQQIASLVDLVHLLVSRVPGAPMQMPHAVPHAAHSAPRAAPAAKAAQPARPAAAAAPVASAAGAPAAERPAAAGAARAASARGPSRRGGLPARVGETSLCRSHVLSIPVAAATRLIASRGSEGQMARDGIVRGALRDASYLGSTRHVRRLFSDCYGPEETAVAAAAVRVAAAAADGVSLPVCLAMNLVRFVHDVSGRDRPAGGGVVSASFLNAKPAVGGIGVEPRRGGVLRVLFTVASDAVADTVVRSRRNLRDVDPSAAVFDVLSDREEAQHRALWPAFLAAKAAGKRAQFHRARLVVDGERVPAPAC
ncbi:hypothetical protein FOA52_011402 [Chlamydomonas sp. UWO 241]|nr:hypothetical protein FOA52_011402 [Chlamydomonas sp. UWO 241]